MLLICKSVYSTTQIYVLAADFVMFDNRTNKDSEPLLQYN